MNLLYVPLQVSMNSVTTSMRDSETNSFLVSIMINEWQLELLLLDAFTDTTLTDVIKSASLMESVDTDTQQHQIREPMQVNQVENQNKCTSTKH